MEPGHHNIMIRQTTYNQKGFTLIETMIAMAIAIVIMGGIFFTFSNQQTTYVSSDRVAEMQQNLRAAMLIMSSEIREAGCDPTRKANAGVVTATSAQFQFTRDIAGSPLNSNHRYDGDLDDANEDVTFGFSAANDADSDGIADTGAADLGRDTGGNLQPIAEHIHAIEFNYILKDGTRSLTPSFFQLPDIRAVQISILARASHFDSNYLNSMTYTTGSGATWGPFNDNYKRRFVTTTVQCRNLGL